MPATPFIDRPSRTVGVTLDDETLDRIDAIRAASGDLVSRAAFLRELILLGLDLHEDPPAALLQLVQGLKAIYGAGQEPFGAVEQ